MNQQPLKQYIQGVWWEWDGQAWVPEPPPEQSTWSKAPLWARLLVGALVVFVLFAVGLSLNWDALPFGHK